MRSEYTLVIKCLYNFKMSLNISLPKSYNLYSCWRAGLFCVSNLVNINFYIKWWLWELDCKEGREPNNWCIRTMVLDKTPESPLDSKEIKPVNLKGNQPWILVGRTDAEVEALCFGHLMWTADPLKNSLMLGKTDARRRRGHQWMRGLDGIADAMDMNLGKLWEMLREREAEHATVHEVAKSRAWWVTEQQQ